VRIVCVGRFPSGTLLPALDPVAGSIGSLHTAEEALRLARDTPPDVWVTEVLLPGVSGFELARRLSARSGAIPVLVLTTLPGVWPLARAIRAGARGYLPMTLAPQRLSDAVRQLAGGAPFWNAPEPCETDHELREAGVEALAPRQFEALHLLLQGFDDSGVARAMSVSPRSAAAYRRQVSSTLGLASSADIDRLARLVSASFYRPQATDRASC